MRVRVLFFKRTVGNFWQKTLGPNGRAQLLIFG
ncbi:hypothetical protein SMQE08_03800 [Serratia marcescens]|nr:hypothetical protein SME46J_03850 [Serratia marcescens]BEO36292.1 hypothetical protein SMQE08_03800 [Serratia marcescens]BEO59972.1 hypothetical protein SMQE30_03950 [Serratia marcescens]